MNTQLINALESAKTLLDEWSDRAESPTVAYEMTTAAVHVGRAIEWEKDIHSMPKLGGSKES